MRSALLAIAGWIFVCPSGRATEPANEIPFNLVRGFAIMTKGQIGAANGLNFMIDTGAVPSVLSKRLASQLGASGDERSYAVVSGDAHSLKSPTASYVNIKDVSIGWAQAANLPMVIVDLRQLESTLGVRVDAIIGLDIFVGQNFTIDYQHRQLVRGLPGNAQHHIAADIKFAAEAPYWIISASWGGRPLRFLLDTGANALAIFEDERTRPYTTNIHSNPPPLSGTAKFAPTAAGAINGQTPFVMGDQSFTHQRPVKANRPAGVLQDTDGLLGPSALRVKRLEFDWANKTVLWDSE